MGGAELDGEEGPLVVGFDGGEVQLMTFLALVCQLLRWARALCGWL